LHRCARLNPKKLAPVPLGKVPVGDPRGQGLPNTVINALAYNPAVDVLAVSAFGRGAWALYTVSVVARFYWTFGGRRRLCITAKLAANVSTTADITTSDR
jgi:hypothetical protein